MRVERVNDNEKPAPKVQAQQGKRVVQTEPENVRD